MQNKKKIVFIGGQELGSKIFSVFLDSKNIEIGLIYELKLDNHEPENFKTIKKRIDEVSLKCKYKKCKLIKELDINEIEKYNPDYIFVINWRTIFSEKLLSIPKYGTIGIHASDLPKYRGFAPVNWAIINGEKNIAITIFYLDKNVDTGEIIQKEYIDILYKDDINSMMKKVKYKYYQMFEKLVLNLNNIKSKKQVGNVTYTCKRKPEDGEINFLFQDSLSIYNLIRSLTYPYPMAFCKLNEKYIFINKAKIKKDKKYVGVIPGRVVSINKDSGSIDILCKDGYILEIIQIHISKTFEYKKEEFINPAKVVKFGDTFK